MFVVYLRTDFPEQSVCPCKKPGDLRLQVATKAWGKRSARASVSDSRDRKSSPTILLFISYSLWRKVVLETISRLYRWYLYAKICHEKEGGWVARDKSGEQGAAECQGRTVRLGTSSISSFHQNTRTHARTHTTTTKFPQMFNSSDSHSD